MKRAATAGRQGNSKQMCAVNFLERRNEHSSLESELKWVNNVNETMP
jgi:hypothetical protein